MDELVTRAKIFATQAHRRINQLRKYTKQPYDVHLRSVAETVRRVTDDPEMIAAAWLHDIAEDTPVTLDDLEREFGRPVMELVEQLTDVSRPSSGNRARRMAINREHTAGATPRAKTIKLADLIDNCRDICKHDPRFAATYLGEMAALLEVLADGDARLVRKARELLDECTERLGLGKAGAVAGSAGREGGVFERRLAARYPRAIRRFARLFHADDLSEPLRSFDAATPVSGLAGVLEEERIAVAGVQVAGTVSGYVRARDCRAGSQAIPRVEFKPDQVIEGEAPLSDVIEVLTRHEFCFVARGGSVGGVIGRADLQKPIARMWLFGLVTVVELFLTSQIRELWPDDGWTSLISPARLKLAKDLRTERLRRDQACTLLDCLQIGDKGTILLRNPLQLATFGFESRRAGEQVMREIQSLRNNLAHAQDIVSNDWPQIVRLARRLESLVAESADDEPPVEG